MTSYSETTPLLSKDRPREAQDASSGGRQPDDLISRLAAALAALRTGKLPTTSQISHIISFCLSSELLLAPTAEHGAGPPLLEGRLSGPTYALLSHLRQTLVTLQTLVEHKNGKDEIQHLLFAFERLAAVAPSEASHADPSASTSSSAPGLDLATAFKATQTLLLLVLRNLMQEGQALVRDVTWMLRAIVADAAEQVSDKADKAAQRVRPRNEKEAGEVVGMQAREIWEQAQHRTGHVVHEDVQDRFLWRLEQALKTIKQDEQCLQAAQTLTSLARKYTTSQTPLDSVQPSEKLRNSLQQTQDALFAFLHSWTKASDLGTPAFNEHLQNVFAGPRDSDDIRQLVDLFIDLLQSCLTDPSFVTSSAAQQRIDHLKEQKHHIQQSHGDWWGSLMRVLRELETAFGDVLEDQDLQDLACHVESLSRSVLEVANKGARVLLGETQGLVSDLVNVLLPRLLGTLVNCPFPRMEFTSPSVDALCDDFVLSELYPLPTFLRFETQSSLEIQQSRDLDDTGFDTDLEAAREPLLAPPTTLESSSRMFMRGIRFLARDISFFVRRKALWWLPCLREETGLLDVTLTKGAEFDVDFNFREPLQGSDDSFLDVRSVSAKLPGLDLRVRRSFHPVLLWFARPILRSAIKIMVRWFVSQQLKSFIEEADRKLFATHRQMQLYEHRGFAIVPALMATLSKRDDEAKSEHDKDEEENVEAEQEEDAPEEESTAHTQITGKGVVKTLEQDEEHGQTAFAVGAGEQLLPNDGGPEHVGPSGPHGSGSAGRIAADLDHKSQDAQKQLRDSKDVVARVTAAAQKLPHLSERVSEEAQLEAQRPAFTRGPVWYSDAFDLG